ncbi:MAG: hypothetical protein EAZ08_05245 [Cytophagales bacterium]|nr:MAG: hypothetical protein EAZ08_05245 [Cytophagales bacterium]
MKKTQLYRLLIAVIVWLICTQNPIQAVAQVAKLANEATFLQDVKTALSKSASRRAGETAVKFEATWAKLNADQKKKVYEISHSISIKALDPLVQLENFYGCITALIEVKKAPTDEVTKFINVAGQTAESYNYSVHILSRFFTTSRVFLEENLLYKSSYYNLQLSKNPQFSFEFVNAATEALREDIKAAAADTLAVVEAPSTESDTSGFLSGDDAFKFDSESSAAPIDTIDYSRPVFEKPIAKPVSGPIIKFGTIDLDMFSQYDTLKITGTTGKLELVAYSFHGIGGKTDWSGEGISATDLFCELDNYEFNTRIPAVSAKYCMLTYKSKTDGKVLGDFEYKSERRSKKEYSQYPKFTSYYADAVVKNLAKEVTYKGGCSLVGRRFTSVNLSNLPSKITISKGGKKKFEASSKQEFIFSDSLITNPLTQVRIFMRNNDSLYIDHIGAQLRYNLGTGLLRARKEKHEYRYTPFFDSYHRMEIFADYVEWNVTQDSMTIAMLTGNIPDSAKVSIAEDPNKKAKLKGLNAIDEEEMKKQQEKEANKSDKEKQKDAEKAKKEAEKAKKNEGFNPDVMEVSGRPQSDYSLSKNPKAKGKGAESEGVKNYAEDISADKVRAEIRSMDYFNDFEYVRLKGLNDFHPLAAALAYSKQVKSTKFSMGGLAKFTKRKPEHIRQAMKSLQRLGYINLDAVSIYSDSARLTRKGVLYANAYNSLVDYDKLEMFSMSEGAHSNMKLDLNTNDLIVHDVPYFPLRRHPKSEEEDADTLPKDKLDVWAKPKSKKVIIKQNRKIVFDGEIEATSQARYRAKGFEFNYDTFQIAMKEADIAFIERDSANRPVRDSTGNYKEMANKIKGSNGVLRLAYPKNKSGELPRFLQQSSPYPYFAAEPGAYIAFDGSEILEGSYSQQDSASKRNKVRIDLEKFRMDSLTTRGIEKTVLDGMFRSNGIFPDFRITARIMPDKAFGFMHDFKQHKDSLDASPPREFPNGYPLYTDALGTKKASTAIFTDHDDTEKWAYDIHEKNGKDVTNQWNIMMDNGGIRGNGKINYLTAQLSSNDYVFFPDSATTLGKMQKNKKMVLKPDLGKSKSELAKMALEKPASWGFIEATPDLNGTSYPDVKMANFQMNWAVKADSMRLSTTKMKNEKTKKDSTLAFEIYGKPSAYKLDANDNSLISSFVGTLVLNPKQLAGDGIIQNKGAEAKSDNFAFQMTKYHADNASYFKIKSSDPKKPALFAKNVKIDYDLEQRFSEIISNNPQALNFSFPYVAYATSLGAARWEFDSKKVLMNVAAGTDASTSIFRSINQKPDSMNLSFNGTNALYDINDHTLKIGGVPFIRSVDAEIVPHKDSAYVTVRRDGKMDEIRNCSMRIMIGGDTAHVLYQANIKINNSQDYEGNGIYYYTNDIATTYKIKFNQFLFDQIDATVETDRKFTYAEATIEEDDNFEKQGGKQFKGTVKMYATRKDLVFEGFTRDSDDPNGFWVATNVGESVITYTGKEKSEDKQDLETGIFLNLDKDNENGLYSVINKPLEGKKNDNKVLFKPDEGSIIKQDPKTKKQVIAVTERQATDEATKTEANYIGNRFAYSNSSGELDFEGNIDIFAHNTKNFNLKTSCIGTGNFKNNQYSLNTMLTIDLGELAGDAFKEMASNILTQADADESPIKIDDNLLYKVAAQVSADEMKSYLKKVQNDRGELSRVLDKKALVISDVTLKWNKLYKAFYSTGDIQLANIYNKNVNQLVKGYIEIPMEPNEIDKTKSTLNIYLEISKNRWYYFSYRGGKLHLVSSNAKFNDIADPKKKQSKDGYELLERAAKSTFLSRFRQAYLNLDTPVEEEEEEDDSETIKKEKDDGDGKK